MERRGQRADIDDVVAFPAHLLGELLHLHFAELDRIDQLDVPVAAFLLRTFVGDDLDAGFLGALEHRLGDLVVERHEADDVDLLGDQVFDQLDLLGRIDVGGADHRSVDLEVLAGLLDAGLERVEPRNARDLDDHDHGRLGGEGEFRDRGAGKRGGTDEFQRFTSVHANFLPWRSAE